MKEALPTTKRIAARAFLYFLLALTGSTIAWCLVAVGALEPASTDFWRSALTALSVLSGFMITTMVFTGKIDVSKSLSLTELREVTAKLNHLLLYQLFTLINHVFAIVGALFVPMIAAQWPSVAPISASLAFGIIFVSLARSVFVPLQILEMHRFTHAALLRDAEKEAAKAASNL